MLARCNLTCLTPERMANTMVLVLWRYMKYLRRRMIYWMEWHNLREYISLDTMCLSLPIRQMDAVATHHLRCNSPSHSFPHLLSAVLYL